MWRRILRDARGLTLVEMTIGLAIGSLIITSVVNLEISAWRNQSADADRFAKQEDAALVVDWILRDVRQMNGTPTITGGVSVSIPTAGGAIAYSFDSVASQVTREAAGASRLVGSGITSLTFSLEDGGATLKVDLSAIPAGGQPYRMVARATRRM